MIKQRQRKDGRLLQARIRPRVPYSKIEKPTDPNAMPTRQLTAKQLAVLLYHFYLTLDNPDYEFLDADKTAGQFQAELNQMVKISQEHLEKLLWHTELAFENKMYWNPAEDDFESFVNSMLEKDEKFNRLYCLITKK